MLGMFALGYVVFVLLAFSLLSLCVLFPIYSHYQLSFFQYIKNPSFSDYSSLINDRTYVGLFIVQFIFSELPGFIFLSELVFLRLSL